jgi:hypothetical protein
MELPHCGPSESAPASLPQIAAKGWASKVYHADIVGNEDKLYKRPGYKKNVALGASQLMNNRWCCRNSCSGSTTPTAS